jgi:hypothetical protein
MERSTEIVYAFLNPWTGLDPFLAHQASAYKYLADADSAEGVRARLCATVTDYLLMQRGTRLKEHWETLDAAPGQTEVDEVNPDQATMMKLNAITGFYGADRVIIHLYLHMYLINALTGEYGGFLDDMDALITKYFRP